MKYYFVTWIHMACVDGLVNVGGSNCLEFYGEFNLYKAHKIISEKEALNKPIIILNWKEVNKNQYDQYHEYVKETLNAEESKVLKLVKNENSRS